MPLRGPIGLCAYGQAVKICQDGSLKLLVNFYGHKTEKGQPHGLQ